MKTIPTGTLRTVALAVVLIVSHLGRPAAQQPSSSPDARLVVTQLASRGRFDDAERFLQTELASQRPDYDLFWSYLHFLTNQTEEAARAAQLGQKWLPAIRNQRPPELGRILKETALGILFGRFRKTHSLNDRLEAQKLLEEAIQTNPDVTEAYLHLAFLAGLEGKAAVGRSLLDRAVETSSDRAQRDVIRRLRDRAKQEDGLLLAVARSLYWIND